MMDRNSRPNNSSYNQDPNWSLNLWRIVRECRKQANCFGFDGDALEDVRRVGSWKEEQQILALIASMNNRIVALNPAFVRRIIRNIVLNSGAWQ